MFNFFHPYPLPHDHSDSSFLLTFGGVMLLITGGYLCRAIARYARRRLDEYNVSEDLSEE